MGFEVGELGGERGGVAAYALDASEVGGEFVALGFEGLDLGDGAAAIAVDGGEIAEDGGGVCIAGRGVLLRRGADWRGRRLGLA